MIEERFESRSADSLGQCFMWLVLLSPPCPYELCPYELWLGGYMSWEVGLPTLAGQPALTAPWWPKCGYLPMACVYPKSQEKVPDSWASGITGSLVPDQTYHGQGCLWPAFHGCPMGTCPPGWDHKKQVLFHFLMEEGEESIFPVCVRLVFSQTAHVP